jgi:RNA polymerase-binding transcription factor DksA
MTLIDERSAPAVLFAKMAELTERLAGFERQASGHHQFPENAAGRDTVERLRSQAAAQLAQIRRALDHLDLGMYGICSICGAAITFGRLQEVPEATECAGCAPHIQG